MRHEAELNIPKRKVERINLLNSMVAKKGLMKRLGYRRNSQLELFAARFADGREANIRFCTSDTGFRIVISLTDIIDGAEVELCRLSNPHNGILGTYELTDGFDDYVVKVTEV